MLSHKNNELNKLYALFKLSSDVAHQNIKTNDASLATTRKELENHIKKARALANNNINLNIEVNKLREDLSNMTAAWKDEEMNHKLHKQVTISLTTDRDRYTVLY